MLQPGGYSHRPIPSADSVSMAVGYDLVRNTSMELPRYLL